MQPSLCQSTQEIALVAKFWQSLAMACLHENDIPSSVDSFLRVLKNLKYHLPMSGFGVGHVTTDIPYGEV